MITGKLKDRVEFVVLSGSDDGQGGLENVAWTIVKTRWCEFKQIRSTEIEKYGQVENPVVATVRTRYTTGIDEEMRIRYKGIIYEIVSIINVNNDNEELLIEVKRHLLDEDEYGENE